MARKRVVKRVAKKAPAKSKAKTRTKPKAKAAKKAVKKVARAAPKRATAARKAAAPSPQIVIPYLCCKGAAAALDFYKTGFGAVEMMRMTGPDGSIGHADMQIFGASVMLSDEWPDGAVYAPTTVGGTPVTIHLYVPDVDAFFARATAAGAETLRPVDDMPYGDRTGTLRDPFGHRWMVATKKEEVGAAELQKRFGEAFKVSY
jgi:PhnB protein